MKVGFLYLDKSYAIYHSIALAIEMSKTAGIEVTLICTESNAKAILHIVEKEDLKLLKVKTIRPYWHFTLPHYLEIKLQFRKVLFQRYHSYLQSFQVLVCPLYNDIELKKYFTTKAQPKLVFCNHGVSNRSYSFSDAITKFDLFFMVGQNEFLIRKKLDQLSAYNHKLIGYLKLEFLKERKALAVFNNDLKTVVYNPHWTKELSSFYKFGFKLLDFFADSKEYNLIFTPHSLLTVRNKTIALRLRKYQKYANIKIDYQSESCNDMSYLKVADLYMGDVSSQALEFLSFKKRPCLFLDAHNIQSQEEEIISWQFGEVYNEIENVDAMLKEVFVAHESKYLSIQERELPDIFHRGERKPSHLAIKAINEVLERK